MKSILIIYATREGQTEKVARAIEEHLTELDIQVKLHNAAEPFYSDISVYDFILFGASMHAGGVEQELIDFIFEHKEKIISKPRAFFMVLLSAASKDENLRQKWLEEATETIERQVPLHFSHIEMIAGALRYSKYSWPLKWIMKNIAKKAGERTQFSKDYEYTDWNQVKKYAESLLNFSS